MPTGTRFKTGNTATLTLAGVLTTGVTTSWVGNIVSINPGEWTITLPQLSTATSGVTRSNIAGNAFFSRVAFPQLMNNETMDSEFTLKMTGESLSFTKEAP